MIEVSQVFSIVSINPVFEVDKDTGSSSAMVMLAVRWNVSPLLVISSLHNTLYMSVVTKGWRSHQVGSEYVYAA